jgi:glycosyltransferase involved in cell wall biosynthesis
MKILLIEPYFGGSHKRWATELQQHSKHEFELLTLSAHHWKWRMHGAAIALAEKYKPGEKLPDLILATDMLDLNLFLSLTRKWSSGIRTALYFHENQLNYPWSPTDKDVYLKRDNHYAFINYASAMAADKLFFNSAYHHAAFLNELPIFLNAFPEPNLLNTVQQIAAKSSVLSLGMDLKKLELSETQILEKPKRAVVLWNHRWEYDKNPEAFFRALFEIQERGIDFHLVVLGEQYAQYPKVFDEAKEILKDKILHWGYVESQEEYAKWLHIADVLPVTAVQDFFGGSVIEAMYCNVVPFLPKRLAYLEHIPDALHNTFFYDESDFVAKLQRRIMDVKYLRVMNTRQYVERYDWSNYVAIYNQTLEMV